MRVHDLAARGECVCELVGHHEPVTGIAVACSLDDDGCILIASCSYDSKAAFGVFGRIVRGQRAMLRAVRGL